MVEPQVFTDPLDALMAKGNEETKVETIDPAIQSPDPEDTDQNKSEVINNPLDEKKEPEVKEEVKTEVKQEVKEEKKEEVKDEFLSIDNLLETPAATQEPEEIVALRQAAQEYNQYKPFLADPNFNAFFKAYAEFRNAGKSDIREFIKNTIGTDYSALPDEQVYKSYLKEFNKMSDPAEMEEQWQIFQGNTDTFKKNQLDSIRQTFDEQANNRVKNYGLSLADERATYEKQVQTALAKGHQDLDTIINTKLLNKDWNGTVITPDMARSVKDGVTALFSNFNFYTPEGGFDAARATRVVLQEKYGDLMYKNAINKIKNSTRHEVVKDVVNVKKESTIDNSSAPVENEQTERKKSLSDFNSGKW